MLRNLSLTTVLFLCPSFLPAQGEQPPVQKVALYKNGMGYFQHLGTVRGDGVLEMELPSSQLDDALKSLTLLDLDGGQITGVTYGSQAPLSRRLDQITLTPSENLAEFLNQIRGSQIQAGTVQGRLLSAETKLRREGEGVHIEVVELSIASAGGEVKLVELERAGGFRILEPELAGDLERFLRLVGESNRSDVRRLKIQTRGTGQRRLFLSYTAEAPIWKTTYRIVLDPKKKALLQGWAIVDNTSAMDWNNVELSLVSGAPVSFIQALSQPIYGRRPVVPVPGGVNAAPQVHGQTLDQLAPGAAEGKLSTEFGGNRAGAASLSESVMMAPSAPPPPPELGEAVRRAAFDTAAGAALGEQFEYRLRQPVTVGRNQSALLSILQSEVEADKVSVFGESQEGPHPRLAIWLQNSSGLTLDGGAFTVIDSNAFAGEGIFETVQPTERRLLSYAIDLAVNVDSKVGSESKRVERVVIRRGTLRLDRKLVETKTYTIRNNADKDRSVVVEHPVRAGWNLVGERKPEEKAANAYRFRVPVAAGSTVQYAVVEERPDQSVYALTNIGSDLIAIWVRDKSIDAATEKTLRDIASRQAEIAELEGRLKRLDEETERIFNDQRRVRDNLGRLGSTPDEARLRQRYVDQLSAQEDQLGQLRAQRDQLSNSLDAKRKDLDRFIQEIDLEREL